MKLSNCLSSISLSKEYTITSLFVLILVLVISGFSIYDTYQFQKKDRLYQYAEEANKLIETLNRDLDYVASLSEFIGNVISQQNDPDNLEFIADLFQRKFSQHKEQNDFYLWSIFTWANKEGNVLVSNEEGILKIPNPIPRNRNYLAKAPLHPWRLYIDNPDRGATSRRYVIPTGMGITDSKNNFIGIITTGLDIYQLAKRFEQILNVNHGFHYLLVTIDHKLVATSSTKGLNKALLPKQLKPLKLRTPTSKDAGFLREPFTLGDVTYRFYFNDYRYPFILLMGESSHLIEKELRQAVSAGLINNLLLALGFIILLYFFHRYIVWPMVKLAQATLEISKGQTNIPIPTTNSLEAKMMANALQKVKRLIENEERLKQKLKHANKYLEERVNERTAKLNELLQVKTQFLNNLSHEIRKPIHTTSNYFEFIIGAKPQFPESYREELLHEAFDSIGELLDLIDTLLNLSNFQAGKQIFDIEKKMFEEVVNTTLESFALLNTSHKPLILEKHFQTTNTLIHCNANAIQQVVHQLLSNAIKYTAKGTIKASIYFSEINYLDNTKKPAIAFSLADTGVGIPENELETIFEP
ncbi:MAG: histidine kinase dimerization/phospho-acceptor domain-containing protein, partial [Burkholderiales bacterium]